MTRLGCAHAPFEPAICRPSGDRRSFYRRRGLCKIMSSQLERKLSNVKLSLNQIQGSAATGILLHVEGPADQVHTCAIYKKESCLHKAPAMMDTANLASRHNPRTWLIAYKSVAEFPQCNHLRHVPLYMQSNTHHDIWTSGQAS